MEKLKVYKRLPVHVVEYHNEALEHVYRAIGSKFLPLKGLTLLHFDSHPDLGVPARLSCDDVFEKEVLFEMISIESWLIPAVFAGHIHTIIWCKPPWSDQIQDGSYSFYVGKSGSSDTLKVSSTEPYYLSDGVFESEDSLQDKKCLTLHILTIDTKNQGSVVESLQLLLESQNYVLDIDIDFFSTQNPFLEMFSEEDTKTLTDLYHFTPPESNQLTALQDCQKQRNEQLHTLRSWIDAIKEEKKVTTDEGSRYENLKNILKNYEASLNKKLDDEDIEIFHGAGCATGDAGLPHHVSSADEIDRLIDCVEYILKQINPPKLITIARSSIDDYCPADQVDDIQHKTEANLCKLFNNLEFFHHYNNE
ncbi:UPF0489 protein C5orf22-like [Clavelina lepadiformis]|uniref:Uncharacterized protein n=1 Tax=Clavelina lepadiformis TaxID=159417 RepID=A0ABP0F5G4_CLALP